MPSPGKGFAGALHALPEGTFTGVAADRRYVVTKSLFSNGRSVKLVAEELGGNDYISLNFYRLTSGDQLYPCEMSIEKVTDFVGALMPDQSDAE
ncbi:hypothetical protein [uncultured Roseobacter sp.]|uniref:hypothetical protein n=1 Tax=uncultured Roseobacter sp. TaxID=114847 RepID=UPI00261397C7|nr:hypothetical protein [uncultured Roseobacter sp.]